jgi:hypothetical protein
MRDLDDEPSDRSGHPVRTRSDVLADRMWLVGVIAEKFLQGRRAELSRAQLEQALRSIPPQDRVELVSLLELPQLGSEEVVRVRERLVPGVEQRVVPTSDLDVVNLSIAGRDQVIVAVGSFREPGRP